MAFHDTAPRRQDPRLQAAWQFGRSEICNPTRNITASYDSIWTPIKRLGELEIEIPFELTFWKPCHDSRPWN